MRKNCCSDREKLLKFEAEGREFAKNFRSLKQFVRTVKGQQFLKNHLFIVRPIISNNIQECWHLDSINKYKTKVYGIFFRCVHKTWDFLLRAWHIVVTFNESQSVTKLSCSMLLLHTVSFDWFLSSLEWIINFELFNKSFDILPEIIMEYQIYA